MSENSISSRKYNIIIDVDLCKGCEICVDMCPFKVFEMSNTIGGYGVPIPAATKENKCTGCNVCVTFCPDMAISIKKVD